MADYIEAGKIVNTHGVQGDVKIEVWLDSPEMLKKAGRLFIDGDGKKIIRSSVNKSFLICHLEEVDTMDSAIALKNNVVSVLKSDIKLPKGRYFISDILGFECVLEDGSSIGKLVDVIENPAQLIYVIKGETEHLVPAVPEFIRKIDADSGTVTVSLIEGM